MVILPTIKATDYMFENYKSFGKEKWEFTQKLLENHILKFWD